MITMFLYKIIDLVFQGLYLALIVRIVLSWIPHDESHPIIQFLYKITDPILRPFQNIVPSYKLGIDISPIFAFIAISIVRRLLLTLLS